MKSSLFTIILLIIDIKLINALNLKFIKGPNLDIDIDPLGRHPSLTPNPKLLKKGKNGAIASDLEICSNLTINSIFKKFPNSNAADAAVTQTLCIGLINSFNSGIGGGGYAVFGSSDLKKQDHLTIDFREQAPGAADKDMFEDCPDASKAGGLSIAVPGEIAGIYELFKKRGSGQVTWYNLVKPVAELAIKGWEVDEVLSAALEVYEPYLTTEEQAEDWAFVLNSTKNGVKRRGDWISRPKFGQMLLELAHNGSSKPFYDPERWIVQSMLKVIKKHDGIITGDDFANYFVNSSKPINVTFRSGFEYAPDNDLTLITSTGSSSGAALLSAIKILDNFESIEGSDYFEEQSFQLIETMKWMASARSRLGDYCVDYKKDKLPSRIGEIMDEDVWIQNAVEKIKNNSNLKETCPKGKRRDSNNETCIYNRFQTLNSWKEYDPIYEMNEPHGTAHFSIVDRFGNAVSLTTTINLLFGSLVHDPKTGVIFNNEMDDFSQPGKSNTFGLAASKFNFPEPLKRPLSSAAPAIIFNELGSVELVIGASGGSRITTSILQNIFRLYWSKMPLLESIAYPRIHHQLLPNRVEVESYAMIGKESIKAIKAMGHKVIEQIPKSVVNGIQRVNGDWHAVSDYWRKRGVSSTF
ncbi:hypothetical protein TBLA_0A09830 [Henningerozyma blattae CBS 6284]|uniref:Glutathione hydrolase n=1 Tax=Henningerozyma blattae (strain ATCC 34711 / CBS 6284 / DSM 70876 / NBRC 10599 / NRRL Y-10934 / UCD 77-7) TaxID=1071380 RepID=I2GXB4_HENB6|nr:hypothetical protein TBLA_0A09830 [Tetrapisispora blattae CBS 6284]CCH58766.1 hypothetical protein TBLA_0A09830 [Tetrapisispora blattae CBS 6284]